MGEGDGAADHFEVVEAEGGVVTLEDDVGGGIARVVDALAAEGGGGDEAWLIEAEGDSALLVVEGGRDGVGEVEIVVAEFVNGAVDGDAHVGVALIVVEVKRVAVEVEAAAAGDGVGEGGVAADHHTRDAVLAKCEGVAREVDGVHNLHGVNTYAHGEGAALNAGRYTVQICVRGERGADDA